MRLRLFSFAVWSEASNARKPSGKSARLMMSSILRPVDSLANLELDVPVPVGSWVTYVIRAAMARSYPSLPSRSSISAGISSFTA